MCEIVELGQEELQLCRTLRLIALKDAPDAFAENYLHAVTKPQEYWQSILESLTPPRRNRMFIARDRDNILGSVYALLDSEDKRAGRLGGMWVDSNVRRNGVGTALFYAVKTWAGELGLSSIKLWVEDTDEGPKAFYSKLEFKESGVKDLTRDKVNKNLCEMKLILGE